MAESLEVRVAKKVNEDMVELEGPYECAFCNGHFSIDSTYLAQAGNYFTCMYCKEELVIDDE